MLKGQFILSDRLLCSHNHIKFIAHYKLHTCIYKDKLAITFKKTQLFRYSVWSIGIIVI